MKNESLSIRLNIEVGRLYAYMINDSHHNLPIDQRRKLYKAISTSSYYDDFYNYLVFLTCIFINSHVQESNPYKDLTMNLIELTANILQTPNYSPTTEQFPIEDTIATIGGLETPLDVTFGITSVTTALCEISGIKPFEEEGKIQLETGLPDEIISGLFLDTTSSAVCAFSDVCFDWDNMPRFNANKDFLEINAYAKNTFNPNFDKKRRQGFWEWWLLEAIPKAWEAANRDNGLQSILSFLI
jgi:hypothetical protein